MAVFAVRSVQPPDRRRHFHLLTSGCMAEGGHSHWTTVALHPRAQARDGARSADQVKDPPSRRQQDQGWRRPHGIGLRDCHRPGRRLDVEQTSLLIERSSRRLSAGFQATRATPCDIKTDAERGVPSISSIQSERALSDGQRQSLGTGGSDARLRSSRTSLATRAASCRENP